MRIGLPDEKGRVQILKIHTRKMRESDCMSEDVSIEELAKETKNFSGAEIEGLVKSASSFALQREVDVNNIKVGKDAKVIVGRTDFQVIFNGFSGVYE